MDYAVYKMNNKNERTCLYDFIDTIEKADLLAQLAMCKKRDDEIIIIMPGWNRGINTKPEEYKRALELAKKYKPE